MTYYPGTTPGDEVVKIHQDAPSTEMGLQRERWNHLPAGSKFTVGNVVNGGAMIELIHDDEPDKPFFVHRRWYTLQYFRGLPKLQGQQAPQFLAADPFSGKR